LPVVSAGSLLEFVLARHNFEMPVGRMEYLFLGPMSFQEYLLAHGQNRLLDLINTFGWDDTFSEAAHEKLLSALRDFFVVGGMPEAVQKSVDEQDLNKVLDVHASICETYQDDFLAADARGVLPIEVKAGQSGALKSLHQFVLHKKVSQAVRYDLNKPSRQMVACAASRGDRVTPVEFTLTSLPLYMIHRTDLWYSQAL